MNVQLNVRPNLGGYHEVNQCSSRVCLDAVRLAFTDAQGFSALLDQKNSKVTAPERTRVLDQVQLLKQADLLVLNEVDWGMNRTLFRNVAADLADALRMNYVV